MASEEKYRLLRPGTLARQLGVSRTTLWRMWNEGDFPPPRQVSPGIHGWLPAEVDEWLQSRSGEAA
jgi:predicted DNA-binding transcriptional regulator AlpA